MTQIADAIAFAAAAHRGQTDKTGQPFLGHPLRVMAYVAEELRDPGAVIRFPDGVPPARVVEVYLLAAVLHDVVEDSDVPLALIERRFGLVVANVVDALSRREGETYRDYIHRCSENLIARLIKRCDIRDNSDPRRQWDGAPLERYRWALKVLDGLEVSA